MKKAALHNLGCKVNTYETEAMQQLLEKAGYEIVSFRDMADVYVINTCAVTNVASQKSRQMIHRARKLNPDAVLVATGCYVQTSVEQVKEDLSIDIVLGNNHKSELVEEIDRFLIERHKEMDIEDINQGRVSYENMSIDKTAEHTRAFLKVQDGCNQFCSYCIIPYARGRIRSREISDVITEVEKLAEASYQEVVLTGIHLSSYGEGEDYKLIDLIEQVASVPKIKRIRLGSLEPQIVTDEFVQRLGQVEKICPHFHLSLQSGCDSVLQRMNRKYDAAQYEEGCRRLRSVFPNCAITTDVIVGFPQETEEEFRITVDYLKKIHFYEMHIFKFSRRKGTRADLMEGQIDEQIKTLRSNELLALADQMSIEYRESFLGHRVEALLEEEIELDGRKYFVGFTREYVRVAVPSERDYHNCLIFGLAKEILCGEYLLLEDVEFSL